MREGGAEDDGMDAEGRPSPTATVTTEITAKISGMGREPTDGMMDASFVVSSVWTSEKEKAPTVGQTVLAMRVSLRVDDMMDMVSTPLPMDPSTRETGKMGNITATVPVSGVMDDFTLASGIWAKLMDKERKLTQMDRFVMMEYGPTIDPFDERCSLAKSFMYTAVYILPAVFIHGYNTF
jgi:hypothetical protein